MEYPQINRTSSRAMLALSLLAFLTVLMGYTQAPLPDEGTLAHIFQLTVVLLFVVGMVFLVTADWKQPRRMVRSVALPTATLALAFSALYYLEHRYYPEHYPADSRATER
jgi:hypothetical protein